MTTYIPFTPSNLIRQEFTAMFDGDEYKVSLTWNVSAQRYYVNIYGLDGTWILTTPLIATPPARKISSVIYDPFLYRTVVKMSDPSQWPIPLSPAGLNTKPGTIVDFTLHQFLPDTYNGLFRSLFVTPFTFAIPMSTDPGPVQILGFVSRVMNMVAGVFTTSTLAYRNGMFEVNP